MSSGSTASMFPRGHGPGCCSRTARGVLQPVAPAVMKPTQRRSLHSQRRYLPVATEGILSAGNWSVPGNVTLRSSQFTAGASGDASVDASCKAAYHSL